MTLTKGLTRLGAAVGLFALVLGLSAAFASTTHSTASAETHTTPLSVDAWT